jgi:hypothetical protein
MWGRHSSTSPDGLGQHAISPTGGRRSCPSATLKELADTQAEEHKGHCTLHMLHIYHIPCTVFYSGIKLWPWQSVWVKLSAVDTCRERMYILSQTQVQQLIYHFSLPLPPPFARCSNLQLQPRNTTENCIYHNRTNLTALQSDVSVTGISRSRSTSYSWIIIISSASD